MSDLSYGDENDELQEEMEYIEMKKQQISEQKDLEENDANKMLKIT